MNIFSSSAWRWSARFVCKGIPPPSVGGPAGDLDPRSVRGCKGFYRAYRSETGRKLKARGECGEQSVGVPAAEDPGQGVEAEQAGGRQERTSAVNRAMGGALGARQALKDLALVL